MVPVYMDAEDQAVSPYGNSDWYAERMSWKWMNTIMRVNSLVMKVSRWWCCEQGPGLLAVVAANAARSRYPMRIGGQRHP